MGKQNICILFALLCLFLSGCESDVSKDQLSQLNGYWEITEVEFPNGKKKEYTVNPTVDFIEINDMTGFKKKVYPKFDGTYRTSDDAEPFKIIEGEKGLLFSYKKGLTEWQERIVLISKDNFAVTNQDGITYSYKRFEPINITP